MTLTAPVDFRPRRPSKCWRSIRNCEDYTMKARLSQVIGLMRRMNHWEGIAEPLIDCWRVK